MGIKSIIEGNEMFEAAKDKRHAGGYRAMLS